MEKNCFSVELIDKEYVQVLSPFLCEENKLFHCHLFIEDEYIELRILFSDSNDSSDYILLNYFSSIAKDNISLSNFLKFNAIKYPDEILDISLIDSFIISISTNSEKENGYSYLSISLNQIEVHSKPELKKDFVSRFYLDDIGFDIISDFYTQLIRVPSENYMFNYKKMQDKISPIIFENFTIEPKMGFNVTSNKNLKIDTIEKKPLFEFTNYFSLSFEELKKSCDNICLLSSFYFNTSIDFKYAYMNFSDKSVFIKKVSNRVSKLPSFGILRAINYKNNYYKFLQEINIFSFVNNNEKLKRIIQKSVQASLVEGSSRFLILYSILEICMGKSNPELSQFSYVKDQKLIEQKFGDASKLLLELLPEEEKEDFIIKWSTMQNKLKFKPMKSPLENYLQAQNIDIENFNKTISKLKKTRDDIVHGSVRKIKNEELDKFNILLHKITNALILNMIGINTWSIE